jgi:hypothetical protein
MESSLVGCRPTCSCSRRYLLLLPPQPLPHAVQARARALPLLRSAHCRAATKAWHLFYAGTAVPLRPAGTSTVVEDLVARLPAVLPPTAAECQAAIVSSQPTVLALQVSDGRVTTSLPS